MRKPSLFRFVLIFASFELPSMAQLSIVGAAPVGAMMHHLFLIRIDKSGVGLQLFFVLSMHIGLNGFQYFFHPMGNIVKSRRAPSVERLGPKE